MACIEFSGLSGSLSITGSLNVSEGISYGTSLRYELLESEGVTQLSGTNVLINIPVQISSSVDLDVRVHAHSASLLNSLLYRGTLSCVRHHGNDVALLSTASLFFNGLNDGNNWNLLLTSSSDNIQVILNSEKDVSWRSSINFVTEQWIDDVNDLEQQEESLVNLTSSQSVLSWYRADEVTGSTPVTTWVDKSGNDNHLDTNGGTNTDLISSWRNGKPAINFSGVGRIGFYGDHNLTTTLSGSDKLFTVIWVGALDQLPASGHAAWWSFAKASAPSNQSQHFVTVFDTGALTTRRIDDSASSSEKFSDAGIISTGSHIHRLQFSGTTIAYYLDGSGSLFVNSSMDVDTLIINRFTIGCRDNSGTFQYFIDGKIAELLITDGSESQEQIEQYESDLSSYYDIDLNT